jgi:uncharacterized protein (TIGR03435 family)
VAFDVVSIRLSKVGGAPGGGVTSDGYFMKNLALWSTIMSAYFPEALWSSDRLIGAPAWIFKDEYDIVAKVDSATLARWRDLTIGQRQDLARPMLQELLRERSKLVLHHTTKEAQVFGLVVKKEGTKCREASAASAAASGIPLPYGGIVVPYAKDSQTREISFFNIPMTSLASYLSHSSPLPVRDMTGLNGKYDCVLGRRDEAGSSSSDPVQGTHWDLDRLGLTLKLTKTLVDTLVIDSIEKPSPN